MKNLASIILATIIIATSTQANYLRSEDKLPEIPREQKTSILHQLYQVQNFPPQIRIPFSPFYISLNQKENPERYKLPED